MYLAEAAYGTVKSNQVMFIRLILIVEELDKFLFQNFV